MAYEKQNWKTGDVVTSAKLNHMEDGIAGGGSGFDAVIKTTTSPITSTADITLVSGDFSSAYAKMQNHDPIFVVLALVTPDTTGTFTFLMPMLDSDVIHLNDSSAFIGSAGTINWTANGLEVEFY